MVIGICRVALRLPESGSLKGKRKIIKSLIVRIREKFNVAVSEVEDHDLWQSAQIGIVTVGNDKVVVNSVLNKINDLIEHVGAAEILDISIEIINV